MATTRLSAANSTWSFINSCWLVRRGLRILHLSVFGNGHSITRSNSSADVNCPRDIRLLTDEPFELIVVDNGSTDGTIEFLKADQTVLLIRNKENRGFPAAANQGIFASQGQQVLLLNNDTIVTTGWLRRLQEALNSNAKVGLVGPVTNRISGEQQVPVTYDDLTQLDGFA